MKHLEIEEKPEKKRASTDVSDSIEEDSKDFGHIYSMDRCEKVEKKQEIFGWGSIKKY